MIEIRNITKKYQNGYIANKNISFNVKRGDVIGLVGPNGSGKTTLIRQMFKLLESTDGSIMVDDQKEYMDLMSYVPQFPAIYPGLTVEESIDIAMRYQGVDKISRKVKLEDVLELLDLQTIRKRYTYMLSGGQQKLLGFACAISVDKPYLILDEVTSMVDIVTREKIWNTIQTLRKGKGILLASHDMDEVKKNCNTIVVLKKGEIIYKGRTDEIKNDYCKCKIKAEENENIVKYVQNRGFYAELEEDAVIIVTRELKEMLTLVNQINQNATITSFECDHPAFYEGVMNLVK